MKESVWGRLNEIDGYLIQSDQARAIVACRCLIAELNTGSQRIPIGGNKRRQCHPLWETWNLMLTPMRLTARRAMEGKLSEARVSLLLARGIFEAGIVDAVSDARPKE